MQKSVEKTIAGLALAAVLALGYYISQHAQNIEWTGRAVSEATLEDYLTIGTWNIESFGHSKINKPDVMDYIARTILENKVDILAVQEIRSKEDVIPALIERLNVSGANYDYIIGPRLGRTSSKEQYAYIYNKNNISYINDSAFTIQDADDLLHREPFVAKFKADSFDFTLINIHTDPDEAEQELNVLDDVYAAVQNDDADENDIIMLGDFNEPGDRLYELGSLPGIVVLLTDRAVKTNTIGTKQYDNILFDENTRDEYTGYVRAFDFEKYFGILQDKALEVSDHRPVFARFSRQGKD